MMYGHVGVAPGTTTFAGPPLGLIFNTGYGRTGSVWPYGYPRWTDLPESILTPPYPADGLKGPNLAFLNVDPVTGLIDPYSDASGAAAPAAAAAAAPAASSHTWMWLVGAAVAGFVVAKVIL